jgi:type IV secretory pathway TrbF-like protein
MTSTPAFDLNNLKFSPARAEEFGYLRRANSIFLSTTLVLAGLLAFTGWELRLARIALANFKPYIIRVNEVGKAEVVYYHDAMTAPQAPEIIRELSDFTTDFYTRMTGRVETYWQSKYLLSEALMVRTYQDDQKTKWVQNVERGAGLMNEVAVNRVNLVSLTPKGGVAYVDFTRTYYQAGVRSGVKENDTATYYFSFLPKVDGKMLQYNPLGICIYDYNLREDFTTKEQENNQ